MTEIEGRDYRSEADENLQSLFLHLRTLARIVKKYHDCGMLHLDIKPENVLLIPETKEQMVLFDFDSMVRKEKIQTQPNSWTFSVSDGYAAPELVRGKCSKICEATDVYAIGAIAFYKLFGRTPNAMDSAVGAIYDFSGMKWKDARYQPVLFRLMQEFFHRTLAATVRRRYASVDEVLEILEKLIRESDVERVFLYHGFAYNTANLLAVKTSCGRSRRYFLPGSRFCFCREWAESEKQSWRNVMLTFMGKNIEPSCLCHIRKVSYRLSAGKISISITFTGSRVKRVWRQKRNILSGNLKF